MLTPIRRWCCVALAGVIAGGVLSGCGGESGESVINLYNAPQENLGQIVERCNARADGYRIVAHTLPRDADSQREQLVRRLAASDSGMDVLGIDITWTAELASAEWIRPWPEKLADQARAGVADAPLRTAEYEDELYGAPYNANVQLLWYRSDLMPEPAETWAELIATAERLAASDEPRYLEITGAQYEGLVVLFNAMLASAGGAMLNDEGTKVELGEPAVRALRQLRDFARSEAADPSMTNMQEDEVRLAVEGGTGFAEINWPFVYAAMMDTDSPIAENFDWAPFPGIDGPGKAPLGGAHFAISQFSNNPKDSFDAALCLRDKESQRIAAVHDGLPPTIEEVYDAQGMAEAYPMRDTIVDALRDAVPRPVTPVYQNVSTVTSKLLSPPSDIDPEVTEAKLREQLVQALNSEGVLPS